MNTTGSHRDERKKEVAVKKSIQAGDWQSFLIEDAAATRGAFAKWYSETYLKSSQGQSTPTAVKRAIARACDPREYLSITRETQLPQTVEVFEAWEAIPIINGTREMAKARVRLIRDILVAGNFQRLQTQALHATPQELEEARRWIHLEADGSFSKYSSLQQPWRQKDLIWNPTAREWKTISVESNGSLGDYEVAATQGLFDPERVRISTRTLQQLKDGTYALQQGNLVPNQPDTSQGAIDLPARPQNPFPFEVDNEEPARSLMDEWLESAAIYNWTYHGNESTSKRVCLPDGQKDVPHDFDIKPTVQDRNTPDSEVSTEIGDDYYNNDDDEGTWIPNGSEKKIENSQGRLIVYTNANNIVVTTRHSQATMAPDFNSLDTENSRATLKEEVSATGTASASRRLMDMMEKSESSTQANNGEKRGGGHGGKRKIEADVDGAPVFDLRSCDDDGDVRDGSKGECNSRTGEKRARIG
ncbi:MAG: hypothetical protein Q9202_002939 [Teloschistes flavicans]